MSFSRSNSLHAFITIRPHFPHFPSLVFASVTSFLNFSALFCIFIFISPSAVLLYILLLLYFPRSSSFHLFIPLNQSSLCTTIFSLSILYFLLAESSLPSPHGFCKQFQHHLHLQCQSPLLMSFVLQIWCRQDRMRVVFCFGNWLPIGRISSRSMLTTW